MFFTSCSSKNDESQVIELPESNVEDGVITVTAAQFASAEMKIGAMEVQPFEQVVKANGMIDVPPQYKADISTHYSGTVKNLKLINGEFVRKGQVLFTLENPEFIQLQQDYLESKAQIAFLKSDYERQKNLLQDNVTSQKSFLKSESDYKVMNVKMESLAKKLELMNIKPTTVSIDQIKTSINVYAPISGYVADVHITTGTYLASSAVALNIVGIDHLHLELSIFEKDLGKVKLEQPIKFSTQASPREVYDGNVHMVDKNIDPEKRTINVHGHIKGSLLGKNFTPGMYVEAKIITQSEPQSALPESAVIEASGKHFALVVKNSSNKEYVFMKKEVIIGEANNGFVHIVNNAEFPKDTKFLVMGGFNLVQD